jgi:integrase
MMPGMRRQLTDKFCASAKTNGDAQSDFFDLATVGLCLRVGANTKTWMYRYSWPKSGPRRWLKLGTYPATSLALARDKAREAREALERKEDPGVALAPPATIRAVCEDYIDCETGKLRSGVIRAQRMRRLIYPVLGDRPIAEVGRGEINKWLKGIAARTERRGASGTATAHQALSFLSRVMNWYALQSDDFRSPIVPGMSPHKLVARARVLTDDEIRSIWQATGDGSAFGRMVRFLLLSACRRDEARNLTGSELSGTDWALPALRNKVGVELLRPLPPLALAQINGHSTGPFIFSNDDGASPLRNMDWPKAQLDKASGVAGWTLHDLRRTARSLMSRAGVQSDHAEMVLGHVLKGVRQMYDRFEYKEEKRRALAKLAQLIDQIITNKPTVLSLHKVER